MDNSETIELCEFEIQENLQEPDSTSVNAKKEFFGTRHVLAIVCFMGLANVYLLRVNLNVAIVAMVISDPEPQQNNVTSCPRNEAQTLKQVVEKKATGEFSWSPYDQGLILGSFFYGYVLTNLVGGYLAECYGGKLVFGLGILLTALLTLLTTVVARISRNALIALRILEGLSEGVVFPALHTLCGRWLPKSERSLLYSVLHTGAEFGTVVGFPIAGALSGSEFLGGWPAVFYVFGTLGIVWFVFWWFLVFESPDAHPRISFEEKKYILTNLEHRSYDQIILGAPWKKIFTSVPVWSVAISSFFTAFSFYIVLTDFSSFLSHILHFDVRTNGFVSSLPHILNLMVQCLGGYLADFILSRKYLGATATRKVLHFSSCLITGSCFLGTILSGCDSFWVLIFVTLGTGAHGLLVPSSAVALLDMAPEHAGTLMGLTNGFANIAGFVAPFVVGLLTDNNETLFQWHLAFYVAMTLNFLGATIFLIFGTSELQPWAKGDVKTTEESEFIPWIDS